MTADNSAQPPSSDLAAMLLEKARGNTPLSIEQIDILLRLISAAGETLRNFLCVGADLAVLATAILEEHPHASGVIVDGSAAALDVARHQLQQHQHNLTFYKIAPGSTDWHQPATTPFDAVVFGPALAIAGTRKRALFFEVFRMLNAGGILLAVENVASATRWSESVLDDYLIDAIFGEELKQGAGKSRAEIAREHFARTTGQGDTVAPLEVQCDWLREAGFESVDCYLKVAEMAVFGGQRPPV